MAPTKLLNGKNIKELINFGTLANKINLNKKNS